MSLTVDQKKAAHSPNSVCVTAGAGTGKTFMLASRYLYHLETGFSPLQIVAMTFTNKAATELRSRIRQTVLTNAPDRSDWLAELEAAQISTFHSLAGRICREHSEAAGVTADFVALDEWDGQLWLTDQLAIALDKLPTELYAQIPYSLLRSAMVAFLADPLSAETALERNQQDWLPLLEDFKKQALETLLNTDIWRSAWDCLSHVSGKAGDKMEEARQIVLSAMKAISQGENLEIALAQIESVDLRGGSAKSWASKEVLAEVKEGLKALKELIKQVKKVGTITLNFTEFDQQIEVAIPTLKKAFNLVQNSLKEAKRQQRILDFNDLEVRALQALQNPDVQAYYAERWQIFLIDEFQDTNPTQGKLLEYLTPQSIMTLVGDEKQSIYGFRRADIKVFQQWRDRLNNSVALSTSFRTHQSLISNINQLFSPVLLELHQELGANRQEASHNSPHLEIFAVTPDPDLKPKPSVDLCRQVEAQHIADLIENLLNDALPVWDKKTGKTRPIQPSDIAVLARTWTPLEGYGQAISQRAFAGQSIPVVQTKGGNLLDSREAKDAFALLQFLADIRNDLSFIAVLRSPFFAVSDRVLYELSQTGQGKSWWQKLESADLPELLPTIITLKTLVKRRNLDPPSRLLQWADKLTGYTAVIANLPYSQRRLADWRGFLDTVRQLEAGMAEVFQVVRRLQRISANSLEIARPPLEAINAVSLMTIHASKGLEWSVVIIPDLTRQSGGRTNTILFDPELGVSWTEEDEAGDKQKPALFTLLEQQQKQRETDEAKRLLYVALTRARDRLILTAPQPQGLGLDLLRSGIEDNFEIQPIEYNPAKLTQFVPLLPPIPDPPSELLLNPVHGRGLTLPITALTDYARCPKRFHYQHLDGHPGLTSGASNFGREIGILTHKALEKKIETVEELENYNHALLPPEKVSEALELANLFQRSPIYESVRGENWEVPMQFSQSHLIFNGKADLVGDDFVVDIKTEQECNPHEHRFQLWAYAHTLKKSQAYIAYLRQNLLHCFSASELESISQEAEVLIQKIGDRVFEATPSEVVCGICPYSTFCEESVILDSE